MNGKWAIHIFLWFWPAIVIGGSIELRFLPPTVPSQDLCVPARSLAEVQKTWAQDTWPTGLSGATIRRDITALRKADAAGNLVTLQRMINGLAERDTKFAGKRALLAEVEVLRAAGALEVIRNRRMVPELAALSTGSSPQVSRALAQFYQEGVGVSPDPTIADQYLRTAAQLGHPDALLTLAARSLKAQGLAAMHDTAKAMIEQAFKALITPLNAGVCDRSARIARAYFEGTLLRKDPELGQQWLRFAADLGDAQAAWKIYELQRLAEDISPDTELRLTYLIKASDAGLPFAQIALGRVYERGALVARDLSRALQLYQMAAEQGSRAGLIRLALFLETHDKVFPQMAATKRRALEALRAMDAPPAWVFTRLANHIRKQAGAEAEAPSVRALYEKAAALGDREAMMRLATLLLSDRSERSHFFRAVDLLGEAVSLHGSTGAAKELFDAYMCKAPQAPLLDQALFWRDQYVAADPALPQAGKDQPPSPARVAALQSLALYRRPSALDPWFTYLAQTTADVALLRFWDGYALDFAQLRAAQQVLSSEVVASGDPRRDAMALLAEIYDRDGHAKAMVMAQNLRSNARDLEAQLEAEVARGSSAALRLLAFRRNDASEATFQKHHKALLTSGDFDALLMAAPYAKDPAKALERAIGVMACDFKSVMAVAQASMRLGDVARVAQFLEIAGHLHRDKPWALARLGDAILTWQGQQSADVATPYLIAAYKGGELAAGKRLLALWQDASSPVFNPQAAQKLRQRIAQQADKS